MKKINLEKLFKDRNQQDGKLPIWAREFCIETCKQTLELAADNVRVQRGLISSWIDKQSILDTINQIE